MADISKIKLPNGSEYSLKDSGAIRKNETGNTQQLRRPSSLAGCNDVTIDSKINTLRANRLAFLPADQVIIEQTVDGGTTWTDAGVSDANKLALFSETRPSINLPRIDGKKNPLCGLRITITAMKYNVPAGTAETAKYNYWNSNYVSSAERYNQLKEMYFWVTVTGGYMNVKVERAKGNSSTTWDVAFDDSSFNMTGYSGNDYISFTQGVFGGGTTKVNQYWNYRITLMTDDALPSGNYLTYAQSVMEIRAYGDTWWTKGNEYAANDKLFTHDASQNAIFPANVQIGIKNDNYGLLPNTNNYNQIGSSSLYWYRAYVTNYYGTTSTVTNWRSGKNIGSPSTSGAASELGSVNFYNTCAAGGTQTKTLLTADSTANSNVTVTLPKKTGTIALLNDIASTSAYGVTKLSTSTSSTATDLAATPSAVKTAYDLASDSTDVPTAGKKAEFDSNAHMNSTDMTTGADSELEDFIDGLNVKGGGLVDYIVEQGTDTKTNITWTYRKWNSGISECWGRASYTATGATAWGNVYWVTPNTQVDFPSSLFTSAPTTTVTTVCNAVQGWGSANNISSSSVNVFLMRPTTLSSGTVTLEIMAKGRWK